MEKQFNEKHLIKYDESVLDDIYNLDSDILLSNKLFIELHRLLMERGDFKVSSVNKGDTMFIAESYKNNNKHILNVIDDYGISVDNVHVTIQDGEKPFAPILVTTVMMTVRPLITRNTTSEQSIKLFDDFYMAVTKFQMRHDRPRDGVNLSSGLSIYNANKELNIKLVTDNATECGVYDGLYPIIAAMYDENEHKIVDVTTDVYITMDAF